MPPVQPDALLIVHSALELSQHAPITFTLKVVPVTVEDTASIVSGPHKPPDICDVENTATVPSRKMLTGTVRFDERFVTVYWNLYRSIHVWLAPKYGLSCVAGFSGLSGNPCPSGSVYAR